MPAPSHSYYCVLSGRPVRPTRVLAAASTEPDGRQTFSVHETVAGPCGPLKTLYDLPHSSGRRLPSAEGMCVVIGGRNVACRHIIMGPLGSQDPPDTVPLRLAKWLHPIIDCPLKVIKAWLDYILPQVDSV